jgi:DNA-directed RNA polymerase specialized sigma24 family protein
MMNGTDHPSPAALMARYCDGESAAFSTLYELMAPDLLARLLDRTADRRRAEALLQQTFLELHERRSAFVRGADPLPWVMTIAEHLAAREITSRPPWLLRAFARIGRSPRKTPSRPTELA